MTRSNGSTRRATGFPVVVPVTVLTTVLLTVLLTVLIAVQSGCRSDLNQQLMERELRMQEDQIYQLQDELHDRSARLSRAVGENASLRRQLGIVDPDASLPAKVSVPAGVAAPGQPTGVPTPMLVPPDVAAPPAAAVPPATTPAPAADGLRFAPPPASGGRAAPTSPPALMPPSLDGVPPLPAEPGAGGPAGRQLSFEESVAVAAAIDHLVVNPTRTECLDTDGDGRTDGLAVVVEPRDAEERLVSAVGDVSIVVLDPSAAPPTASADGCIARWDISGRDAVAHFRRTSRARGLHFTLPWPGPPPAAGHVRVVVRMSAPDGRVHETDATVAVR